MLCLTILEGVESRNLGWKAHGCIKKLLKSWFTFQTRKKKINGCQKNRVRNAMITSIFLKVVPKIIWNEKRFSCFIYLWHKITNSKRCTNKPLSISTCLIQQMFSPKQCITHINILIHRKLWNHLWLNYFLVLSDCHIFFMFGYLVIRFAFFNISDK